MKKAQASWGSVADWYDAHLQDDDTYHTKVILPNLMRLVAKTVEDGSPDTPHRGVFRGDGAGKTALDIACGQGYFTRALVKQGFRTSGADIAPELIEHAKKSGAEHIRYEVASAEKMPFLDGEFDVATCVLALQNMKDLHGAVREAARVVKKGGSYIVVLNHPAFRVPKHSSWGWDEKHFIQYRRLDRYLSETHTEIEMHPGQEVSEQTISYHRPLQVYIKALTKSGFVLAGLEEWDSHKKSEKGPRSEAEDRARKEFPLFLMLHARRV